MADNARHTGPAVEAHYQLLNWLMPTIARFPREQRFLLGDRLQLTALDVLEALIEATYTRDLRVHLLRANLVLEKLRHLVRLASELGLLDARRYEHAARSIDEIGRQIGGWMKAHAAQSGNGHAEAQVPQPDPTDHAVALLPTLTRPSSRTPSSTTTCSTPHIPGARPRRGSW